MPRPPDPPDASPEPPRPSAAEPSAESTATDLAITPPDFLQEIHETLGEAERAYAKGNLAEAARVAEEGLAVVRLTAERLGEAAVPPHYPAFFHCLRIQPEYRQALALYKHALARREHRAGCAAGNGAPGAAAGEEDLRRAWQILGPAVAPLAGDVEAEVLVFDFPVAGRVLRGVARLRDKLRGLVGT